MTPGDSPHIYNVIDDRARTGGVCSPRRAGVAAAQSAARALGIGERSRGLRAINSFVVSPHFQVHLPAAELLRQQFILSLEQENVLDVLASLDEARPGDAAQRRHYRPTPARCPTPCPSTTRRRHLPR